MRTLVAALSLAATIVPALALTQTIGPKEAKSHVGQNVTVEGTVSNVYTARSGATFIDIGGNFPDNAFTAVIFAGDSGKFPGVNGLNGRIVDINGPVQLYQERPEIVLRSAAQLKAK